MNGKICPRFDLKSGMGQGRKNHFRSKKYNLSYFIAELLLSQTAPCSETDLISSCTGM